MHRKNQAVLITAYKNFDYLLNLTGRLVKGFDIFIHIDKKASIDKSVIEQLKELGCTVIKKYRINWGGGNHLYAIISLLRIAAKFEYSYYHIISGEDYPVKPIAYYQDFFKNNNLIYLSFFKANGSIWEERYKYYYIFRNRKARSSIIHRMNSFSIGIQKALKISRSNIGNYYDIYKGVVYCSLPKDAVNYLLEFIANNPLFMRQLSLTLIPEEFFFQTVLGNSKFKHRIVSNNLRYSVWEDKNGSNPGYLDLSDFYSIIEGNYIFARKLKYDVSSELIAAIDNNNENEKNMINEPIKGN